MSNSNGLETASGPGLWVLRILGALIVLIGLPLIWLGAELSLLGGSWYYLLAGLVLAIVGVLTFRRRVLAIWLFAALFVATLIWAFAEAGLNFWPLVPRLGGPIVIALILALCAPLFPAWRAGRTAPFGFAALCVVVLVAAGVMAFQPQGVIRNTIENSVPGKAVTEVADNWQAYGRTPSGTRYAPFEQINKDNVKDLKIAWTYQTGDAPGPSQEDQATPMLVDDTAYVCTPKSNIHAVDINTGTARWVYDSKTDASAFARCRGVSYYQYEAPSAAAASTDTTAAATPVAPTSDPAVCAGRIVLSTTDARLIEVDAGTGLPCADFGVGGIVDLKAGMGETFPQYVPTSAPTIARNLIIIGGLVLDNLSVGEPSGVVRAFDARTGALVWAWDSGRPNGGLPAPGENYTRGTPNVWSTPAYDDTLGLVYLPTGNATPDFWGAHRTEQMERVSAAVVALDATTGAERWVFKTVHHDIWDYDVPAQPALYDVPDGKGGTIPALIQITKRGQIFMLDRRDGKPIAQVEEKPVPQDVQAGDTVSPTQPYSVGMPAIGVAPLTEARMWGATLYDQLLCRIEFKQLHYEGDFTPPGTHTSLQWPGYYGGFNWGSAAINEKTGTLIVNDMRVAQYVQLVPRDDFDSQAKGGGDLHAGLSEQAGTPFAALKDNFFSPLGVPCQEPPYGTLTGIDLATKQIAWQVPMGTLEETGPLGIKTGLPIPIGMPTIGGSSTTAGGLVFYAATQDYYLRAFDVATGQELWKGKLPVGTQSTPSTYVSKASGKQYVVLTAGGARQQPLKGDYIVAFALPN
jgi:quinate dehydrogenase (quinone)